MVVKVSYTAEERKSVSLEINLNTGKFEVYRRTASGVWADRYTDRAQAERRFNQFESLNDAQLERLARCPQ